MKPSKQELETNRPYECCLRYGPRALTDAQLLAVIIRTGTRGRTAIELSEKILKLPCGMPGLQGVCQLTAEELMTVPGIGEVKAIQILCVGELSRRIATKRARERLSFRDPETIADYYMEQLRHEEREVLVCAMLDNRNRLIGDEKISVGTVNASLLSPRELFLAALRYHAVNIVLIHNHPSGDPEPSREDLGITGVVRDAGTLLGISLLDHIVIGDRRYYSFAEHGFFQDAR